MGGISRKPPLPSCPMTNTPRSYPSPQGQLMDCRNSPLPCFPTTRHPGPLSKHQDLPFSSQSTGGIFSRIAEIPPCPASPQRDTLLLCGRALFNQIPQLRIGLPVPRNPSSAPVTCPTGSRARGQPTHTLCCATRLLPHFWHHKESNKRGGHHSVGVHGQCCATLTPSPPLAPQGQ